MVVLRWLWTETGKEEVAPKIIYYTLRGVMFILSFVLEDWAIHELVHSPRQRRVVMVLVASSYVTWTYQTHTFSNSIETLVVLWSVVLIQRLMENQVRILDANWGSTVIDTRDSTRQSTHQPSLAPWSSLASSIGSPSRHLSYFQASISSLTSLASESFSYPHPSSSLT